MPPLLAGGKGETVAMKGARRRKGRGWWGEDGAEGGGRGNEGSCGGWKGK